MHGIYKVEKMLCDELDKIGERNELTAGSLETADTLAHALKNVQKVIEYYEEMGNDDYSRADRSYDDGSYRRGGSYARGDGRGRGRNARRDSMGRYSSYGGGYSRAEDMKSELRELMETAENPQIKQKLEKLMSEMDM